MVHAFIGVVAACILCIAGLGPHSADATEATSVSKLAGRWSGQATMTPASGPSENFKCVITYVPSEDGSQVKQNLRCKGPNASFDAATYLNIAGNQVTGHWQDNVYSLKGSVRGSLTEQGFDIALLGRFFAAKMRIVTSPCEQSVTVTPDDPTHMKELSAVLKKC